MRRMILCLDCRADAQEAYKTDVLEQDEHVKYVAGKAKQNFLCDTCGCEIKAQYPCCAFSNWSDYSGLPYYNWESDFIDEKSKEVVKDGTKIT